MNEREMATLLERATRDLAPDVETLVAGGLRRGEVRERRRRMTVAVTATMAAVVTIVVAGSQLLGPGGIGNRTIDPTDQRPSSVGPSSPTISAPEPNDPPKAARLGVTTEQVPTTFATLEPGEVSAPSASSGPDAAPVVDFTWNGFGVRVGLTPDDYATGRSVRDPSRRCAEEAERDQCRSGPGGTVIRTSSSTNPEIDGGTEVRSVTVFRPDGWDVLVMAYNGPAKEGPVTADNPPFTLTELQRVAVSDTWFR